MLPAARVFNHRGPQDACRSVEIEKQPAAAARAVFNHKVAVQQHRFHFRQQAVIPVQITPACLHHSHPWIGEVMHCTRQKIARRNKVGVENRNQLARRRAHPLLQRPRLETVAVRSMQIFDRHARRLIIANQPLREGVRVVGGIIQHLDLQQVLRILHLAHFFE